MELQSQLNSPVTVFVDDLTKTIHCGLVERKAPCGIAHWVRRLADTIVNTGRRTSIGQVEFAPFIENDDIITAVPVRVPQKGRGPL